MFDFFKPKVLFDAQSPYNGHVMVVKAFGVTKLLSDGVTQSADYSSSYARSGYWHKAAEIIIKLKPTAENVLFLGMGSGTAIRYISESLPRAHLVAVEIDPIMIDVAKRFFSFSEIPNLKLITADAFEYIKTSPRFDVLFVDLFRGGFFVPVADFATFFKQLHAITKPKGLVVFNYTFKKVEAGVKIAEFTSRMSDFFNSVAYEVVPGSAETSNYLIYGCN